MEKTSTKKSHAGRWLVLLLVVVVGVIVLGLVTSDQSSDSSTNGLRNDKLT